MSDLVKLESKSILDLFSNGGLGPVLNEIQKQVKEHEADITTDKGRKEIASLANKIAKSKTYLDALGKDLVSEWKSKSKLVDNERKSVRDYLDKLKEETRKPLTDWENIEKQRVLEIEQAIEDIKHYSRVSNNGELLSLIELKESLQIVEGITIDETFGDYEFAANNQKESTILALENAIIQSQKIEKERVELAELKAEKETRDKKDYEEKIAREATAKAHAEAETKAREDAEKIKKLEMEKIEAEKKKLKDEKERIDCEKLRLAKEKQDAIDAETKRIDSIKQAEIDAEEKARAAVEVERARVAKEKEESDLIEAKKEANKKHVKKIHNEILECMVKIEGISEKDARSIIVQIAKGNIANLKINY